MFNELKGLENGFCHTWQCGSSPERTKIFKTYYKASVDENKFIREITNAPRDARYKIDYYYNSNTTPSFTVPYPYINSHKDVLKYLNIDDTFNWKERLVDNKSEYTHGDFTIGYGDFDEESWDGKKLNKITCFYFKHKGIINTQKFMHSPTPVDYTDSFWARYKGKVDLYYTIADLLHNIRYFMSYNNINF